MKNTEVKPTSIEFEYTKDKASRDGTPYFFDLFLPHCLFDTHSSHRTTLIRPSVYKRISID